MARFEALITPVADGQALRAALEQIAQSWGAALTWLDRRNASLELISGGLPVKLLLELRRGDVLGVLVSSREGMGRRGTPKKKASRPIAEGALIARSPCPGAIPLQPRRTDLSRSLRAKQVTGRDRWGFCTH